jgi:hypothetical protein
MKKAKPDLSEIELVPDAWPRFEQFIKKVAKAGPQHRKPSEGEPTASPKPRRRKEPGA